MNIQLPFDIQPQPDDMTCGPACLHALYRYYEDRASFDTVIEEVRQLESGGTLAVLLGLDALNRGYRAKIYTCNLKMFDPSWFTPDAPPIQERLIAQAKAKRTPKFREATMAYVEFLNRGGTIHMEDITPKLIAGILEKRTPIITGLSATWLYQCKRERPKDSEPDDAQGQPVGHFVVIHGLDASSRQATVADPYLHEPYPASHHYNVNLGRLIGAILLGIVTYDAKMLIIRPASYE